MRNKPSYTYDTVVEIKEITGTEEKINIIIGTDAFQYIETWNNADKLKELVHFILFVREDNFDETPFLELKQKGYEYTLMKMPFMNISASEVRNRVSQNQEIYDIVPYKVAEYIRQNNVY